MDNCHKIDKLNITSNGLFDKIVNAVFIITLSKNGKQKNIEKQYTPVASFVLCVFH